MDENTYLEGFRLSFENAKRLFKSAELLESQKEFAIANSLLILSAEEALKAFTILTQRVFSDNVLEDFDKSFEDHKHKLYTIRILMTYSKIMQKFSELIYQPALDNIVTDRSRAKMEKDKVDGVNKMNKWLREATDSKGDLSQQNKWWMHAKGLKESGFYVGFKKGKWLKPTSINKTTYSKTKKYVSSFVNHVEAIYNFDLEAEDVLKLFGDYKEIIKNIESKKKPTT